MIKYLLKCKDCKQEFESWFSASNEYDRLLKLKLLNCQTCESVNVEKSLMSPNLLNTKKKENLKEIKKYKDIRKKLSDYKKFVKIILNMLEKILLTKQDQFITIKRNQKKVFMVVLLLKMLRN